MFKIVVASASSTTDYLLSDRRQTSRAKLGEGPRVPLDQFAKCMAYRLKAVIAGGESIGVIGRER